MTAASVEEDESSKIASLAPEIKQILHQSILHYLHRSGFSKTLKRFQSEAQIQNDTWRASSLHLEDIYCKYVDVHGKTTTSKKKKKKSGVESENGATEDQLKAAKNHGEILEHNVVAESETKAKKKKKKSKHELASPGETMNGFVVDESNKKPKDKKRKNTQKDEQEPNTENGGVHSDVTKNEKTSCKKRKRSSSDENEHLSAEVETIEESKWASKEDKADESDPQGNPASQKSMKRQRNGSAEPKTINAFQRVKIDQVEFAHEKLQDNSYWAKDGADVGYGAKAQEVLGQVRGRDFRHEKTKKKRGSYRGGQIDLQSHSIKFNYSDE